MAQQSRHLQKIFGSTGGTSEFGRIGSEAAGSPTTTKDLDNIQSLSQYLQGLYAITASANEPPRIQDINALYFLITSQLSYLFQNGIPKYLSTEEYYVNSVIIDSNGDLYISLTGTDGSPNQGNTPSSSPSNWSLLVKKTGALNKAVAGEINAMSEKVSLVNDDEFIIEDSAASYGKKKAKYSTVKSYTTAKEVVIKTADYTILDTDTGDIFILNPNTVSQYGELNLKAVEVGSGTSKIYRAEHGVNRGTCRIDANQDGTAQVFDWFGQDLQYIKLYHPGDFVEWYWNTNKSKWSIYNYKIKFETKFIAGSDYSSSSPGAGVTYDNGSGTSTKSVDWTGMVVTEATSGITAIVSGDTGGSGKAGILYFYDFDGTPRYFTNNRVLTASNGETIDVNQASGTSKDIIYAVYHGFGANVITNIVTYHVPLAIGTPTYAGAMQIANNVGDVDNGANVHGQTIHFTNSNQFQNYTSSSTGFQHVTVAYGYSQGVNTYYAYVITF